MLQCARFLSLEVCEVEFSIWVHSDITFHCSQREQHEIHFVKRSQQCLLRIPEILDFASHCLSQKEWKFTRIIFITFSFYSSLTDQVKLIEATISMNR